MAAPATLHAEVGVKVRLVLDEESRNQLRQLVEPFGLILVEAFWAEKNWQDLQDALARIAELESGA